MEGYNKRPKFISLICIVGYISVVLTFPQVFSPSVKKLGAFIPALFGVLVAAHFIACVGIWYLKRWGVQLYLIAFFAKTLFYMLSDQTGIGFYLGIALNLVFIPVLISHYRRFDTNL